MAHSSSKDRSLVTATFRDREHAERAYDSVTNRKGYSKDDVSIMMSDETRDRHFGEEHRDTEMGNKAAEGAGVGAATGGTLGGVVGAIAAIGAGIAIPGIGLILAGPLAGAIGGAGAGGAAGTLVGGLIGAGIPEKRAKRYESDIKEGNIVMAVEPHSDEDARHFRNEWETHGDHLHGGDGHEGDHHDGDHHDGDHHDGDHHDGDHHGSYSRHEDDFRRHFSDNYGSDADYATYEPAYRYGHEMANHDRFRDRDYADAEKDLRTRYEERHPNSSWDKVKGAVKHAFRNTRSSGRRTTR